MDDATYLKTLRDVRERVEARSLAIRASLAGDTDRLDAFQLARADLDAMISKLETRELQPIEAQLSVLGPKLEKGVVELEQELEALDDTVRAVEGFTAVVALAARIAAAA
jgi:hypothetical protein